MNVEQARFNMIEQQIRPWDVLEPSVLGLLARVRREDFVPDAHQALAFVDTQVPLIEGSPQGTCMLEPRVEARMLQELRLQPSDRVLEVGTGSGFMACLLAGMAGDVTSLEIRAELAVQARENLRQAGVDNARVLHADGSTGHAQGGPFDAIVLSGSVAEVPAALLQQLKVGGRLLAIVGQEPIMRARLFTRAAEQAFSHVDLFDTVAPRLLNFPEPSRFKF
jgi:protein-L-isoaspartate(D-aspartate) O-methyltransferase